MRSYIRSPVYHEPVRKMGVEAVDALIRKTDGLQTRPTWLRFMDPMRDSCVVKFLPNPRHRAAAV